MIDYKEINRIKDELCQAFENGERPTEIVSSSGVHGLHWDKDQDEFDYVLVGCVLPEGVYADFCDGNDGTYGELGALRVYLTNETTGV